jgi:hypothetical protein
VRFVYWTYVAAFVLLLGNSPLQNIAAHPSLILPSAIQIASTAAAAAGMLLYRAPRKKWQRLRQFWKVVVVAVLSQFLFDVWTEAADVVHSEPSMLTLMVILDALLIIFAIPAFWMNIRFSFGYSARSLWFRSNDKGRTAGTSAVTLDQNSVPLWLTDFSTVKAETTRRIIPWALMVAIFAATIGIVNVFFTFQNYKLTRAQPSLGVYAYKVERDQEFWYEDMQLDEDVVTVGDMGRELALPLKVINNSDYDAVDVTVWLRADSKDAQLVTLNPAYTTEEYAGRQWIVTNMGRLSPHTAIKYHGIILHMPKTAANLRVLWQIYAAHTRPLRGSVKLTFGSH